MWQQLIQYVQSLPNALFVNTVWFLIGVVASLLVGIPSRIRAQRRKRAWPSSDRMCVFTGSTSQDRADSTVVRSGDFFSVAKLYGYLASLFPQAKIRILSDVQIENVGDAMQDHLCLIGGPNNNVVTKRVLEQWNAKNIPTPSFPEGELEFLNRTFKLRHDEANSITQDIGLVARGENPFNEGGAVTICMGIKSFGTHAATQFSISDRFAREVEEISKATGRVQVWILTVEVSGDSIIGFTVSRDQI